MKVLEKLLGSPEKIKILRLFILNPNTVFEPKDISRRTKSSTRKTNKELNLLKGISFIQKRSTFIDKTVRGKVKKNKIKGWQLNSNFQLLSPLTKLLFNAEIFKEEDILRKIKKAGKLTLIVISGIFINEDTSRADLLVVGDYVKRGVLENIIRGIEAEIGRELNYGVFETEDFMYRLSVCDKFVRDVLDYPHKKIFNRLKEFEEFQ